MEEKKDTAKHPKLIKPANPKPTDEKVVFYQAEFVYW